MPTAQDLPERRSERQPEPGIPSLQGGEDSTTSAAPSARLVRRGIRLNTLLTAGVSLAALGTLVQVVLVLTAGETLAGTWASLFVTVAAIGLIFPAVMSIAQTLGRRSPGAASAVLGGLQFLCGALASPLVGLFGEGSSLPMAVIMLCAMAAAAVALTALARPWRREGEPSDA
ncbi:hypothetical protein ABZ330_13255 [Streptomyces sp. NPDC006172]|uniref:hypothetical protein n=1 Tax=Streptomyces sp. NPDC006172 TaxID=3154470 RepID=UPI0033D727B6